MTRKADQISTITKTKNISARILLLVAVHVRIQVKKNAHIIEVKIIQEENIDQIPKKVELNNESVHTPRKGDVIIVNVMIEKKSLCRDVTVKKILI